MRTYRLSLALELDWHEGCQDIFALHGLSIQPWISPSTCMFVALKVLLGNSPLALEVR